MQIGRLSCIAVYFLAFSLSSAFVSGFTLKMGKYECELDCSCCRFARIERAHIFLYQVSSRLESPKLGTIRKRI